MKIEKIKKKNRISRRSSFNELYFIYHLNKKSFILELCVFVNQISISGLRRSKINSFLVPKRCLQQTSILRPPGDISIIPGSQGDSQ